MRPTRAAAVALAAGTALAAGLVFADPPAAPAHDLTRVDRWQAGDVATTTLQDVRSFRSSVAVKAGEAAQEQAFERRTVAVRVERCVDADAEGNRTKLLVWFREWSVESTERGKSEKDESLKGAYVDVSGRGRDRHWSLVASPTPPSERAKEWLAKAYGPGSASEEMLRRSRQPKQPVAVGEKWEGDVGPLLDAAFPDLPADRAKAKVTYALSAVDDKTKFATVTYDLSLPLTSLPVGKTQPATPWRKGGTYLIRGNATVALNDPAVGRVAGGGAATQGLLNGEVVWQGRPMSVVLQVRRQESLRLGGEIPDPKFGGDVPPPAPSGPK